MRLELRSPIFYTQGHEDTGEILYCYEINPVQGCSIEPDHKRFLGNLVFAGKKDTGDNKGEQVLLPAGLYLFSQHRGDAALNQEEWLDMAIEQQKDGLWERHKPGNLLYVRYLHEDGAFVTQVFRVLA